uniref:Uncharacterized protein n=1 Tax=Anguilla anguilla TaxID=7936 RepID=A0A0E9VPJ4_ANGAN
MIPACSCTAAISPARRWTW